MTNSGDDSIATCNREGQNPCLMRVDYACLCVLGVCRIKVVYNLQVF